MESNENKDDQQGPVEYGEYVPFFVGIKGQLKLEFFYLIAVFIIAILGLFIIRQDICFPFSKESKWYLYAGLGGLLGGWAYDVKWFYRVTGRGKDNQYPWKYEENKFYWRFFVPFLSAVIGFSFVTGYFSDIVYSKLANWFENTLGSKKY